MPVVGVQILSSKMLEKLRGQFYDVASPVSWAVRLNIAKNNLDLLLEIFSSQWKRPSLFMT